MRWLEVTEGARFDLSRSLVPQFPRGLLDAQSSEELRDT